MPHLPHAKPEELGLDRGRITDAYTKLKEWTNRRNNPIPGAAIVIGRQGRILPPVFFGKQGPERNADPIREDGMFLLASITKPVTCMAALKLVEQGLLNLSDPVMRYIPEFASHHKENTLVAHLMTHTSGMPDMLPNNADLRRRHAPLARFIEGAINTMPLFPPGTDYSYQSMGTLIVAELIQRLSGKPVAEFIQSEILEPLGMTSTGLGSKGFDRERLVRVETPEYQGRSNFGWNSKYWQELGAPWGGMFTTPEDFAVLCQVMLNGGELGNVRVFSESTVRTATTNRLEDFPQLSEAIRRTQPWGLGWRLNHRTSSSTFGDLLGPRAYGHTGATGTMCWIDPDLGGFCLLLTTALRSSAPWRLVQLSNMITSAFDMQPAGRMH